MGAEGYFHLFLRVGLGAICRTMGPVRSVCLAGFFPHRVPHSLEEEGIGSECGCAEELQVEPSSPQGAAGDRSC